MTNYLSGRQNAVTAENPDELNEKFAAIAERFGLAWLEQSNDNPLQKLWARKDALATNELLNFGDAILRFTASNLGWAERQVEIVKTGDVGNRSGAIFELLGLNLFQSAGYKLSATKYNSPGYDGIVHLDNNASLWVSIKNHGMSSSEQDFRNKAAELEIKYRNWLRRSNLTGIEVRIFCGRYPLLSDWNELEKDLERVIGAINTPSANAITTRSIWNIIVKNLPPEYLPLSAHHLSSMFFIGAKSHPNEQANFLDNIRKGCANLAKHAKNALENVCPTLLVRLSATASVLNCTEWTKEYFETYPNEPVDLVILYQAAVAANIAKGASSITHYIIPVTSQKCRDWSANADNIARNLDGSKNLAKFEHF